MQVTATTLAKAFRAFADVIEGDRGEVSSKAEKAGRAIDEAPKTAPKATKPKKEKVEEETFDLSPEATAEETGFDDAAPEEAPSFTKTEVIAQLRKFSTEIKGGSREKAIAAVKKFAKSGNVNDVVANDYAALMKMIGA